jgi:hypothetical protein
LRRPSLTTPDHVWTGDKILLVPVRSTQRGAMVQVPGDSGGVCGASVTHKGGIKADIGRL